VDYDKYAKDCEEIRKHNAQLLGDFDRWLSQKGLATRTVGKHVGNVDFYINEFLLDEEAEEAKDGAYDIGLFLGYWFVKKALWSSQSAIRENAASLKKFYQFMHERGDISDEALTHLNERIKEDMPDWLATMGRYDDPDIEDPSEIWGF